MRSGKMNGAAIAGRVLLLEIHPTDMCLGRGRGAGCKELIWSDAHGRVYFHYIQ